MKVKAYLLNSFGADPSGGNPAGVVLDADNLTDAQKLYIAHKIGFSETAFVQKSQKADFKVTFFTPTEEVDICAHATIATYSLLSSQHKISPGKYIQEILAGILPVEIHEDGTIFMDQAKPIFPEFIDAEKIAPLLNIDANAITTTGLSPQIVSTGSREILIPIKDRQTLFSLTPDFEKMKELNKETKTNGYKVFTLDTISKNATAHSRDFAPYVGIPEESATGITTGALACYLYQNGKLSKDLSHLLFEQGYSMQKPSLILASLEVAKETIKRIQIGGKAILIGEKGVKL